MYSPSRGCRITESQHHNHSGNHFLPFQTRLMTRSFSRVLACVLSFCTYFFHIDSVHVFSTCLLNQLSIACLSISAHEFEESITYSNKRVYRHNRGGAEQRVGTSRTDNLLSKSVHGASIQLELLKWSQLGDQLVHCADHLHKACILVRHAQQGIGKLNITRDVTPKAIINQ